MITIIHGTPNSGIKLESRDGSTPRLVQYEFQFKFSRGYERLYYTSMRHNGSEDVDCKRYTFYNKGRYFFTLDELENLMSELDFKEFKRLHT